MEDKRKPIECIHYPLCQDLKTVGRDIPTSFSGMHAIVMQREAEPICSECLDFQEKDMAGAA